MRCAISLLLASLLMCATAQAVLPLEVDGKPLPSLAPMLERVTPAVVNISTISQVRVEDHPLLRDPFFRWFLEVPRQRQHRQSQSLGSGVIVDARRGHIITNHHVIEKAERIRVTLHDGRELDAELLGTDPDTDVAVLRIAPEDLTALPLADSSRLRVGDFVVAIGNPFGLTQTVTSGIVSALGRSGLGIEGYENFIQTDASINPGNSGGPLVNLRGELVGINTAILAPSGGNVGIGFAIPVNMADAITRQIVEYGSIHRGTFGVTAQSLSRELALALRIAAGTKGAVVNGIEPRSAAAAAGLRTGDIIVAMNSRPVTSATDLETQLALLRVGSRVKLQVLRDGDTLFLDAGIADPFEHFVAGRTIDDELRGARLDDVIDESRFGSNAGILVGPVEEDSNAWNNGLRQGDVVFQINRQRVRNMKQLKAAIGRSIVHVKLRRGSRLVTLVVR